MDTSVISYNPFPVCDVCGSNPVKTIIIGGSRRSLCAACAQNRPSLKPSTEMQVIIDDAMFLTDYDAERYCGTSHLLGALLRSEIGQGALLAVGVMDMSGLTEYFKKYLFSLSVEAAPFSLMLPYTDDAEAALERARTLALSEHSSLIETRHLAHALSDGEKEGMAQLLRQVGVPSQTTAPVAGNAKKEKSALSVYARDLTRDAADGKIDPIIGREKETSQVSEILARRRKNNPVLIGEPGVGKTSVVEGLALRIVNGQVPDSIKNCRIWSLDLAAMIAGAGMQGDFEDRLKKVIKEVIESKGKVILFIDELHNIRKAGRGSIEAANILKPVLARGELRCMGATTFEEYRHIESDGALARRFQVVTVREPTVKETVSILRGLKDRYEAHHRLRYTDESLVAAVRLSSRYISESFRPDKAIDLIDQAGARVRARSVATTPEIEHLRQKIAGAIVVKDKAISERRTEDADMDREHVSQLEAELLALQETEMSAISPIEVREQDVIEVLADKIGMSVGDLAANELAKLVHLEAKLHKHVIGQDAAVAVVADAVRRARTGLAAADEPLGVFLFLGPSGVGKTELAKALAEHVMGFEKALIRLDGSEYSHSHTAARLVSAPPGYIGHGVAGQLTEPVRRRPYSVVLIDEVEKMHPDVWNYLLQVMDDGRLTDGEGRTADFRNTIIILTSNIGAGKATRGIGFAADSGTEQHQERLLEEAKRVLPAEFYNRIDDAVVFLPLTKEDAHAITAKLCREFSTKLFTERNVKLVFPAELVGKLADDGLDERFGARPLRRHLRKTLEKAIVDAIMSGKINRNQKVLAKSGEQGVTLTVTALLPPLRKSRPPVPSPLAQYAVVLASESAEDV